MKKKLFISILALCVSSAFLFGQARGKYVEEEEYYDEVDYKRNAFGIDLGFGGTQYNKEWWWNNQWGPNHTGSAFTFDFGFRFLHNFSPYFGVDFFKFKLVNLGFKNVNELTYFDLNPQLMTGFRGYSPMFTDGGMRAFGAGRLGYGVLFSTFNDFDKVEVGHGLCYELEVGLYLNHTIFVAFAYNHQGGTFVDLRGIDGKNLGIGGNHFAFRLGFDLGGRGGGKRRGGGGSGGGSGAGASSAPQTQKAEPETKTVEVKEERQLPCYTIQEMKELIRKREDIRGKKICAIKQITFEFGKSTLTRSDKRYLDEIVDLMTENNKIHIRINGHTDNIGTEDFNISLSRERAKSVYDYITSQGIAAYRLSYNYYGFSRPITDNDTEEGRAINRRVEFEIVSQ